MFNKYDGWPSFAMLTDHYLSLMYHVSSHPFLVKRDHLSLVLHLLGLGDVGKPPYTIRQPIWCQGKLQPNISVTQLTKIK